MLNQDILNIIYQYFPKNLYDTDENYQDTVEFKKLERICLSAEKNNQLWKDFLEELEVEFEGHEIEDSTQLFRNDRCYRCTVALKNEVEKLYRTLVVHVSIIAPVCSIYLSEVKLENGLYTHPHISFQPRTVVDEVDFSRAVLSVEKIFGYKLLAEEFLTLAVPDVAVGNQLLNESTVFHCLFTDHII